MKFQLLEIPILNREHNVRRKFERTMSAKFRLIWLNCFWRRRVLNGFFVKINPNFYIW